ncbi:MAG TPA: NlpC/P60 family protein [Marmoricola sp.]|nr:NlpC/P60 family protein [Marmoricola sp.]
MPVTRRSTMPTAALTGRSAYVPRHRLETPRGARSPLRRAASVALATGTAVAGTAAFGPVAPAAADHGAEHGSGDGWRVNDAADVAVNQIGDRYEYGGTGPDSFDCSGLVQYSYRKAGFEHFPRTSSAQADRAHKIAKEDLKRGDLMVFADGGGVYHVALFLRWEDGHAVMVDAQNEDKPVERHRPWTSDWYAATVRG